MHLHHSLHTYISAVNGFPSPHLPLPPSQANRVLRLGSLSTLNALMASYADQIPAAVRDGVIAELAPLVR